MHALRTHTAFKIPITVSCIIESDGCNSFTPHRTQDAHLGSPFETTCRRKASFGMNEIEQDTQKTPLKGMQLPNL
jgi:hypothetical protein